MKTGYDRFDAAFRNVSAMALLFQGAPVGRIVWKYGAAATCYFQLWSGPMHHGRATGYGYCKRGASAAKAISSLRLALVLGHEVAALKDSQPELAALIENFSLATLAEVSHGAGWETLRSELERVGFVLAPVI